MKKIVKNTLKKGVTSLMIGAIAMSGSSLVANAYSKSFDFSWTSQSVYGKTYCSEEGHQLKTVIKATQKHPQSKDVKSVTRTNVTNGSYKSCSLRITPYQGYYFTSANGKGYIDGSQI